MKLCVRGARSRQRSNVCIQLNTQFMCVCARRVSMVAVGVVVFAVVATDVDLFVSFWKL